MKTVDDETFARALGFVDNARRSGKPFFVCSRVSESTRGRAATRALPRRLGEEERLFQLVGQSRPRFSSMTDWSAALVKPSRLKS